MRSIRDGQDMSECRVLLSGCEVVVGVAPEDLAGVDLVHKTEAFGKMSYDSLIEHSQKYGRFILNICYPGRVTVLPGNRFYVMLSTGNSSSLRWSVCDDKIANIKNTQYNVNMLMDAYPGL